MSSACDECKGFGMVVAHHGWQRTGGTWSYVTFTGGRTGVVCCGVCKGTGLKTDMLRVRYDGTDGCDRD